MRATRSTFGRQVVAVRQSAPSFSFGGTGGRFGNPAGRSVSLVARPPRNASPAAAERPSVERTFVAASPGPIYLLNDLTGQALAYTLARRPPSIFEPRQSGPSRYLRTPSARRSRPASAAPEQQGARTTAQARAHARPASAVASRRYDDAIDPSGGFTFGSRAGFKPLAHCESVDAFYELESTLGRARSQSAFASAPVAAWAGSRLARFERPERATARALPGTSVLSATLAAARDAASPQHPCARASRGARAHALARVRRSCTLCRSVWSGLLILCARRVRRLAAGKRKGAGLRERDGAERDRAARGLGRARPRLVRRERGRLWTAAGACACACAHVYRPRAPLPALPAGGGSEWDRRARSLGSRRMSLRYVRTHVVCAHTQHRPPACPPAPALPVAAHAGERDRIRSALLSGRKATRDAEGEAHTGRARAGARRLRRLAALKLHVVLSASPCRAAQPA
jgi:hypothetical protein